MSLKSPHRFDLINSMDASNLVEYEDILKPLECIHFSENYYNLQTLLSIERLTITVYLRFFHLMEGKHLCKHSFYWYDIISKVLFWASITLSKLTS